MSYTTSEVLDLAADDIQRNGWEQGLAGMRVDGPHCILGAIGSVLSSTAYPSNCPTVDDLNFVGLAYDMHEVGKSPAGEAMIDYLPTPAWSTSGMPSYSQVYRWNDASSRTAEEVVAALRAAAAIQRAYETEDQPLPIEVAA